ncbi:MAG TPA: Rha family transcriptional regulator [Bacillota bacterium]|nr:Rha family transcriptional regulator [Bacillota bacterium]
MEKLVFIQNDQVVTDSLTVAEVFGKRHADVLRDIEVQIEKLNEAGESEWGLSNFAQTQYQHQQNKQWYPKYNLSEDAFAIVAMSYVTPEAMKMKVRFIQEFKRMKEQLTKPQSQLEILQASINQLVEQERRMTQFEQRLIDTEKRQDEIKEIISLNPTEWRKKVNAIINKIAKNRGGHEAYQEVRNESYKRLEERAACQLSIRLTNKQRKMALEGVAKSKIDKVTKLEVIADDSRLTEIYLAIVKEMAIQYRVDVSEFKDQNKAV